MKQLLQSYRSGELWLADVAAPALMPGGVIVQTASSFVSAGTERMMVEFARKNLLGKAAAMPDQVQKVLRKIKTEGFFAAIEKVRAKLDQPVVLGYSCAGIIEEVGSEVTGLSAGDRVACGGAGYAGHGEYNFVPRNLTVGIPKGVSFEDASCAAIGAVALQGVRQCDLRLGESACVIGLGLVGLLAGQMLRAGGVRVIGYDPDAGRCALARELGLEAAVSDNCISACCDFSGGMGVDAVLIAAAAESDGPVALAGEVARMKGRVVAAGKVGMNIPRDLYYKKELDFRLSMSYGPGRYDPQYEEKGIDYPYGYVRWTERRNMETFLDLVARGAVTPSKLITHRFDFDDALQAYELLLGKKKNPALGIVLNYPQKLSQVAEDRTGITPGAVQTFHGGGIAKSPGIALIGAGSFACGVLLPRLRGRKDLLRKAVCDVSGTAVSGAARKFGFEYHTTDVKRILEDENIHAVFIATRHDSHCELVVRCLEAGKHVHVEKPLALNTVQLHRIIECYNKQSSILTVGYNRRFSAHTALIRQYFRERRSPMAITFRVNAGLVPPDSWVNDPRVGGGRIIGEACHFVDLAGFLIGSAPVRVTASALGGPETQDSVCFIIDYEDGSLATVQYLSLGTPEVPKERCEVFADQSVAVLDDFRETVCKGRLGKKRLHGGQDKGFDQAIGAFLGAVSAGGAPPIPIESLCGTSQITFAVLDSLKSNKPVLI